MTTDYYTYDETDERELNDVAQPQQAEVPNNQFGVAKIKVIGVGGAGGNAVNRLIESGLKAPDYYVVNTDNQVLVRSLAQNRIQIGAKITKGLGAGANPEVGKQAAEENKDLLQEILKGTDLLFITAGMGGGTGTGAAPVIAKLAREMKILTVAVVTIPFSFEGKRKMDIALAGVEELKKYVDSIIVIPNDKLRSVVEPGTSFQDALKVADEVLRQGIRGIAELIAVPALINLDFADVRTTLKDRGIAHMGIGIAKGEKRIAEAVRCAVCSPLLNTTIEGASSVILNIVGGDITLEEAAQAADLVKGVSDYSANIIFGAAIDNSMSDEVEIVIIATGFPSENQTISSNTAESQSAVQRAAALSDKIDRAFGYPGQGGQVPQLQQPMGYGATTQGGAAYQNVGNGYYGTSQQPVMQPNGQGYAQYQGGYAPQQNIPTYQTDPENNVGSGQNNFAQNTQGNFEPETPIDVPQNEEGTEKKHRPKFIDFFMKKK